MSRALAPAERREGDAYYTPAALASALVSLLPVAGKACWEPHAGGGAFVRALIQNGATTVVGTDIAAGDWGPGWDFLEQARAPLGVQVDWIVGNPPFRGFEDHIDRALDLAPNVAFLLRLGCMESRARVSCWARWPLRRVWVLAERPSFTGGGTDSAAYGFFVFERGYTGAAEVVPGWSWKSAS